MSLEEFREFINQRLTAAAAEIFEAFEKTINNYKDEVDRYKDMLEIVCKPHVKMHQIEISRQLVDPEPHRPESSDNEESMEKITCINQDGAEVLLEKQDIKESQDVCSIKSEPHQEQEFQPQSSPVVLWGKDQDGRGNEGRPVVKMEDRDPLQGQMDVTGELNIQFHSTELTPHHVFKEEHSPGHHLCMKTSDHSPDQCGSESTRTEEDNQEVGIIQEREQSVQKQADGQGQSETGSQSDPNRKIGEKPFKCETCGISFSRRYSLKVHLKVHMGERPYPCETCGKCFGHKNNLERHMLIHAGERPFSCATCGKRFAQSKDLKCHEVVHTGEKPYSCETCGKLFGYKQRLRDHMKTHTGERPYSCETCGKTFVHSYALSYHRVLHTGEKPFSCATCGKCFVYKRQHREHVRTHTGERPYSCEICSKSYIMKGHLNAHMRYHIDRKHSCDVCGKTFVHTGHLKTHMKVHKSEKPYTC